MITDVSNLTPEQRAAVPGAPGVPAPVLPLSNAIPDQQAAPDQQPAGVPAGPIAPIGAPPVPAQGIVNQIHKGADDAAQNTPPAQRGKPGQWAANILQGLNKAFSNVGTSLGDIQTANESLERSNPYGGGGIIGGLAALENAKSARQAAEKQAATREDMARAQIAQINVQTYHQNVLNHRESGDLSDKINNEAIQTGKQAVDAATLNAVDAGLDPSKIIHSNITEQQQHALLASNGWDPTQHTVWETSSQPLIDPATGKQKEDADGSKQYQKMYTIIDTPDKIVLNDESAATLNKYLHTDFKSGQELPGALGLSQFQMAANIHALQSNRDAQLSKIDELAASAQQKLARDKAQENLGTDFLQVVSGLPYVSDQMKFVSGQHMIPDPTGKNPNGIVDPRSADYAQKHPNAPNDLVDSYGGKTTYQALVLNETKEVEKARHDAADEAQKGQVTPEDRFKEQQADYRAELGKKSAKADGLEKTGLTELQKSADDYSKFLFTANSAKSSIQNATNGDQLANSLGPLQTALLVTSANGVHRINTTEVDAAGPKVGSAARRVDAMLEKAGTGKLPADTLKEMANLVDLYTEAKYGSYVRNAVYAAKLRGLDPDSTPILDKNGDLTTIGEAQKGLPKALAAQSSKFQVTAPDGSLHTFKDQQGVDSFKKLAGIK